MRDVSNLASNALFYATVIAYLAAAVLYLGFLSGVRASARQSLSDISTEEVKGPSPRRTCSSGSARRCTSRTSTSLA